ncbi:MAG: septal ring lytic transglycosylase RlpA family protein [Nitrospirae bacterium]|nr:septal ring lytic transglycosylase RlpA family protein [Nitrospirota bacterium]
MKTSAGIYFKDSNGSSATSDELKDKRESGGSLLNEVTRHSLFILIAAFLASCSAARYGTVSDSATGFSSAGLAEEKPVEKPSGRKTYAFQEFKGDRQQIIASWYGPDFHGRPTSSGEPFNMYALTCAHREYPFGTKLRVVNKQNNKVVECIVNDRGPFIPGRDLDLSYAAARKIDLIGPGTCAVTIEPVGRDLRYVKYVKYSASEGALTIQVGSFRDEANAKRLKMALDLHYKNVYIMDANVGGAKYFRVRIGKFNNKNDAAALGKSLADEGYNVMVTSIVFQK